MTGDRPASLEDARAELQRLYAERERVSRTFFTLIPTGLGLLTLIIGLQSAPNMLLLVLFSGVLSGWGVLTGLGLLPAPVPRTYTNKARIEFLEGFVAGAEDDRPPPR
jgi:hypothetical protein